MADLFWFKFFPDKWLAGKIRKEKPIVKVAMMELICQYWKNHGILTVDDAKDEVGEVAFRRLLDRKIIKTENDVVRISFLDEQFAGIENESNKARDAANKRWENERKMHAHADALPSHKLAMPNDAEKSRVDKTRVKKKREEVEIPFVGELLDAWNEWMEYRRERKLPNTNAGIKKQIKFLAGRPDDEIKTIIDSSIRNNWQGLFELKNNTTNGFRHNTKAEHRTTDAVIEEGKSFGVAKGRGF